MFRQCRILYPRIKYPCVNNLARINQFHGAVSPKVVLSFRKDSQYKNSQRNHTNFGHRPKPSRYWLMVHLYLLFGAMGLMWLDPWEQG